MTTTAITGSAAAQTTAQTTATSQKFGLSSLGQGDFLKLMTEQLKMQDPFEPTDNKEMLAQMAQFSSLSGITEMGATLKTIAGKLDAILSAQGAVLSAAASAVTTATASGTATDSGAATQTPA